MTLRDDQDRPALDVDGIGAEAEARAIAACPDEDAAVRTLLEALRPPRWTLEWSLPWWLATALGVPADVARELVISNVLGLASFRLRDDALDGEAGLEPGRVGAIASALLDRAIATYRDLFEPSSPVWSEIRRSIEDWRQAVIDWAPAVAGEPPAMPDTTTAAIARRGAPLRICVSAVCLLAARPDAEPALHAAVEHALAAWVLADDADDWLEDVRGGRRNLFVRALVPDPDPTLSPADLVDEVAIAMLGSDRLRVYHDQIRLEADRAADMADAAIGPSPFSEHVRTYGERHAARGARMQGEYDAITERATRLLFGHPRARGRPGAAGTSRSAGEDRRMPPNPSKSSRSSASRSSTPKSSGSGSSTSKPGPKTSAARPSAGKASPAKASPARTSSAKSSAAGPAPKAPAKTPAKAPAKAAASTPAAGSAAKSATGTSRATGATGASKATKPKPYRGRGELEGNRPGLALIVGRGIVKEEFYARLRAGTTKMKKATKDDVGLELSKEDVEVLESLDWQAIDRNVEELRALLPTLKARKDAASW